LTLKRVSLSSKSKLRKQWLGFISTQLCYLLLLMFVFLPFLYTAFLVYNDSNLYYNQNCDNFFFKNFLNHLFCWMENLKLHLLKNSWTKNNFAGSNSNLSISEGLCNLNWFFYFVFLLFSLPDSIEEYLQWITVK